MAMQTTQDKSYHHGDLRRALLDAAQAELAAGGLENFSLRKVARRAGVSHAAPAHHFKDAKGLLTALATDGYSRFADALQTGMREELSPREQMIEMGLGYVGFALEDPARFRLLFSSERPDSGDPKLADAAQCAFNVLVDGVAAFCGAHPYQDAKALDLACALWSVAHGAADLLISNRMGLVGNLPEPARRAMLARMFGRALDG